MESAKNYKPAPAKFSPEEAVQIRREYVFLQLSVKKLAKKYNANQGTITKILKKKRPYDV
jgi:hypothetical protein